MELTYQQKVSQLEAEFQQEIKESDLQYLKEAKEIAGLYTFFIVYAEKEESRNCYFIIDEESIQMKVFGLTLKFELLEETYSVYFGEEFISKHLLGLSELRYLLYLYSKKNGNKPFIVDVVKNTCLKHVMKHEQFMKNILFILTKSRLEREMEEINDFFGMKFQNAFNIVH